MVGEGLQSGDLHDSSLGTALEAICEHGITEMFYTVAQNMLARFRCPNALLPTNWRNQISQASFCRIYLLILFLNRTVPRGSAQKSTLFLSLRVASLDRFSYHHQLIARVGRKRMGNPMAKANKEDMAIVKELLEAGKVVPVID